MANTLKLNNAWDIQLDINGNLLRVNGDYAVAQNVANACRAFTQDMYFHQQDGVPHFLLDIGTRPNYGVLTAYLEREAKTVAEVATAKLTAISVNERVLEGDLQITTTGNSVINIVI